MGQTTVAAKVKKSTHVTSHAAAVTENGAAETTSAVNERAMETASIVESNEAPAEMLAAETYLRFQNSHYTYGEFQRDLNQLRKQAGSALRVDVLDRTIDGSQPYNLRIGSPEAKYHLLVSDDIHTREYITVQLVMQQTVGPLATQQKNDSLRDAVIRDLLTDTEIYLIPMTDPDGVSISQLGVDGIHTEAVRETIRNIASKDGKQLMAGYLQQWRSNADDVNLNRNFDALWESYNDYLGHVSADHYKGTASECEIESKALADLTRRVKFGTTLGYHTQDEVIYWNFGREGALRDMTLALAKRTAELTGCRLDGNFQALDTAGYKNRAILKMGIPSLTVEAGHGGNPVDPTQMESIWRENKDVMPMTPEVIIKGEVYHISETKQPGGADEITEGKGRTHVVVLAAAGVVTVGTVAGVLIASQRPEKRFEAAAPQTEARETETRHETETNTAGTETAAMTAATAPATTVATEGTPPVTATTTVAPVTVAAMATVVTDYSRTTYASRYTQSISLRESPATTARAVEQIPFAAPVIVLETADNNFYKIIYNGTIGYSFASYLISYQPDGSGRLDKSVGTVETTTVPGPTYRTMFCMNCREYITFRSVPDMKGTDLAHVPLGASVSYVRTADNGFYEVIYNGKHGYALAQYLSY